MTIASYVIRLFSVVGRDILYLRAKQFERLYLVLLGVCAVFIKRPGEPFSDNL